MDSHQDLETKIRRDSYRALLRAVLFYPAVLIAASTGMALTLIVQSPDRTARVLSLLLAILFGLGLFAAFGIDWARRRADRVAGFVAKLRPRLTDAALTREEGLILILNNHLLICVENTLLAPMANRSMGFWMFADKSAIILELSIADFLRWHRRYHRLRVLRPLGASIEALNRLNSLRTRVKSPSAQFALFERDLGPPYAPEGVIREAAAFILQPRWWAMGDGVRAEVDEIAAFLTSLVRSPTDATPLFPRPRVRVKS